MSQLGHHFTFLVHHRLQHVHKAAEAQTLLDHGRTQGLLLHLLQLGATQCHILHMRVHQGLQAVIRLSFARLLLQAQRIAGALLQLAATALILFGMVLIDGGHGAFPVLDLILQRLHKAVHNGAREGLQARLDRLVAQANARQGGADLLGCTWKQRWTTKLELKFCAKFQLSEIMARHRIPPLQYVALLPLHATRHLDKLRTRSTTGLTSRLHSARRVSSLVCAHYASYLRRFEQLPI